MSSALSDPKLDDDKAEENVTVSTEHSTNLMSNSPPPDDNYLETLSRFGITVNRVAKKSTTTEPSSSSKEPSPAPELDQLLNNSSISLKSIPKLTPKPRSPPSSDREDDDPISRLGALGIGVSIKRKSTETVTDPLLTTEEVPNLDVPSLDSLAELGVSIKRTEKDERKRSVDSLASDDFSSSVSIERKPRCSESLEDLPSSISITPTKKTETTEDNTISITPTKKPETTEEESESTPPVEPKKTQQPPDNEQPSTSRASSRSSKLRRSSAVNNAVYNWLDYEEPKSRCNSRSSSVSLTPSELRDLDSESDFSDTAPKRKVRGGKRGRGRGRGGKGAKKRKSKKYETDHCFSSGVKANPVPRRQTRGKKIFLNNYSESEESDFERYINEESSESPVRQKELREEAELEKLLLEQEIKEELLDEQEQLLSELQKADFRNEAQEPEPEDHHEEEHLHDGDIEDDLEEEELLLEGDTDEEENPPEEDTKTDDAAKPAINILKNEDYSEVLRSTTDPSTEEETPQQSEVQSTTSESVDTSAIASAKRALEDYHSEKSDFEDLPDNRSEHSIESDYSLSSNKQGEAPTKRVRSSTDAARYPSDDLFCWHCKRNFSKKTLFWRHISSHIRLPFVYLTRVNKEEIEEHCGVGYEYIPQEPKMTSLKLTLKTNNNHEFEIVNKPEDMETEPTETQPTETEQTSTTAEDSGMEDAVGSDNMELEDSKNLADHDSGNGSERTESIASDRDDKPETPTYIPGVRIRSLESVQKLEVPETPKTPTSSSNSPTLRVRTNLTSPQSNFIGTQPNLYEQQPPQYDPAQYPGWQPGYGQPQAGYGQAQMGPPTYSQQSMQHYNGNSYYQSQYQSTYVQNDAFGQNPGQYWNNSGVQPVPGPTATPIESTDPLAMPGDDDPLKITSSGEKEQETHGNLLKSFLDGPNEASTVTQLTDTNSAAEFMPLDRLHTCSHCSERFQDSTALEDHKRLLNHYTPQPATTSPSTALQPIGSQALQTLANAHSGIQPIQHQIRVQHNVIVNNVIQQGSPIGQPPYGQPPLDNSMQQLAQQVNRMPPPNQQYPGYPQQPYPQQPYRHPTMPPGQGQPPGGYQQPYQYPNQQATQPPATTSPSQQYPPRPQQTPPRPAAPGMQNMRPRGQAYLPQGGPPPPHGMRGPVRQYRPGPMSRTRPQMGPRLQGPGARPNAPGMNQGNRMRRPSGPASVQQNQDSKRKRMDMLLPDRHEDPDCHVIAVQQRNDDLPVIQNVQGNVNDPTQDALNKAKELIQLGDSVSLSVRGKDGNVIQPQAPKGPANEVADILATRGITVTPTAKSNGVQIKPISSNDNASVAINLNNSVTLIPAKTAAKPATVDLTDEPRNAASSLARPDKPYKCSICPKQFNSQELYTQHVIKHRTLPYRCTGCNAAYPKQIDLQNHQKTCRAGQGAAASSASDLGLPVVDLRKPQVLQNLSRLGIQHYIPLARGNQSGVFGLPVVSVEGARNPNIINLGALGASNLLPLGPVKQIQLQNTPQR